MKRLTICIFSCLFVAGSFWLAHNVWGQAPDNKVSDNKDQAVTMTRAQWKELLDKAIAADREKTGRGGPAVVTDEEVHKGEHWHFAVYKQMAFVIYTGPGQAMFHHWVEPAAPPAKGGQLVPRAPAAPSAPGAGGK